MDLFRKRCRDGNPCYCFPDNVTRLHGEEEARIRATILDLYANFTARVAANRSMDIERVEQAAQGRVYSGRGALNAGLIDSIGGLDDAVRIARELATIPDNKRITYNEYPKPRFYDRMLDRMMTTRSGSRTSGAALFVADMLFPAPLLEDLRFRLANNGQVMPILPLDSSW